MNRTLLLGIDVGTQGVRTALVDPVGNIHASHRTTYDTIIPRPGWAEQDPQIWWDCTLEGIRRVIQDASVMPGEVVALGISAQMHAAIPLGAGGELLSHSVQIWCDKRAHPLVAAYQDQPLTLKSNRIAGSPPMEAWWGFKLKWLKENQPELYQKTWQFVTGEGYLEFMLTGNTAIDWSEASGSYMLDIASLDWSPELAHSLEIDLAKLPPVLPSSQVMGSVNRETSHLTGLPEGTPVVAGAGDLLCMCIACGLVEKGRALDVSGTASNLVFYLDLPILDPPLMNLHHAAPGWCPFGVVDSGGGSVKWFKDHFCSAEIVQAEKEDVDVYDILNRQVEKAGPGAEGLLFLPYMMGERLLGSPQARGAFIGLTPRSDQGAMLRAIMEGITFDLRRTLEIVEGAGYPIDEIYTSGGGARSAVWSQIKANIYQKPVVTLQAEEGGVLGAAILAGVGAGVFSDIVSATRQCVRVQRVFQPDRSTYPRYNELFSLFKDIHDRLQEPYNRLADLTG